MNLSLIIIILSKVALTSVCVNFFGLYHVFPWLVIFCFNLEVVQSISLGEFGVSSHLHYYYYVFRSMVIQRFLSVWHTADSGLGYQHKTFNIKYKFILVLQYSHDVAQTLSGEHSQDIPARHSPTALTHE